MFVFLWLLRTVSPVKWHHLNFVPLKCKYLFIYLVIQQVLIECFQEVERKGEGDEGHRLWGGSSSTSINVLIFPFFCHLTHKKIVLKIKSSLHLQNLNVKNSRYFITFSNHYNWYHYYWYYLSNVQSLLQGALWCKWGRAGEGNLTTRNCQSGL